MPDDAMVLGRLDTGHFSFVTVGSTKREVRRRLREAWAAHRRQTGATWLFSELDCQIERLRVGTVYRDGSPFYRG